MSWREFWGWRPRLASAALREAAPLRDYIAIRFRVLHLLGRNPFSGGKGGRRPHTDVQDQLNQAQALQIADLHALVTAVNEPLRKAEVSQHRPVKVVDFDELLRPVILGPSSSDTLLKQGRELAERRYQAFGHEHRDYLTPVLASRLSASGDRATLADLIESHTRAIELIGRGLMAAQAHASGIRKVINQVEKGRRPKDETISREVVDSLPYFSVGEMASLSFASAVNASLIWNDRFGDTRKVGYFFLHEFAVFAGRLARGEPAPLSSDLANYIAVERFSAGIADAARMAAYDSLVPAHEAFLALWNQVDTVYGREAFCGEVTECVRSDQARTLRIRGFHS